jgi:hypothetical protein
MERRVRQHFLIRGVYRNHGLRFTDREHGRTAPPHLRKHCGGCGRTLPNRSRFSICPDCYPQFRRQEKMMAERRRRQRVPDGGVG